MLIKNVSIFYGKDLDYIQNTNVRISGKYIGQIGPKLFPHKDETVLDCEGLLMMPGMINSHTHIGDSIAKDIGIDSDVEEKIHPVSGFKQKNAYHQRECFLQMRLVAIKWTRIYGCC